MVVRERMRPGRGAPDLSYGMAAEILLLIETLDRPHPAPTE